MCRHGFLLYVSQFHLFFLIVVARRDGGRRVVLVEGMCEWAFHIWLVCLSRLTFPLLRMTRHVVRWAWSSHRLSPQWFRKSISISKRGIFRVSKLWCEGGGKLPFENKVTRDRWVSFCLHVLPSRFLSSISWSSSVYHCKLISSLPVYVYIATKFPDTEGATFLFQSTTSSYNNICRTEATPPSCSLMD